MTVTTIPSINLRLLFTLMAGAALALAFSFEASAHPGHASPIDKVGAIERGKEEIVRLIAIKKLPPLWSEAAATEATLDGLGGFKEWRVVFTLPDDVKNEQRKLYIFLMENGDYIAANFSGG